MRIYQYSIALIFALGAYLNVSAQSSADTLFLLQDSSTNNSLKIGILNSSMTDAAFYVGSDSMVSVYMYFSEFDSLNGSYIGQYQSDLTSGYIVFEGLEIQDIDSLTVGIIDTIFDYPDTLSGGYDTLFNGRIIEHRFIQGEYMAPTSGGESGSVPCPIGLACVLGPDPENIWFNGGIHLLFDPNEYLVANSNPVEFSIYGGNNFPLNGQYVQTNINYAINSIFLRFRMFKSIASGLDFNEICNQINNGEVIISINGQNCLFRGGLPSNESCNPLSTLYSGMNNSCLPYLEGCTDEIINLFGNYQNDFLCKQWDQNSQVYNTCSTGNHIFKTNGRVAIGTSGFSSYGNLTVKNGIITKKMKVELCQDGNWCDYVFEPDYKLMPLDSVEHFIRENKHLPGQYSGKLIEKDEVLPIHWTENRLK